MFFVIELQRTDSDNVPYLITAHKTKDEAEQKYHLVLSAAAVSEVPIHSAVMIDDSGISIKNETYVHGSTEDEEDLHVII